MRIVELLIDEDEIIEGVQAMGVVTRPAIEKNFVAFKGKDKAMQFAEVSGEKKILLGPAMIPNQMIYREDEQGPYQVYYSAATVRKASQLFFRNGRQNSATLEHEVGVGGMSVVESWIIEDTEKDKSQLYGFDLPPGTWMIAMKVFDDDIWNDFIKTGVLQGFSIEGFFSDDEMRAKKQIKAAIEALIKLKA